MAGNVDFTNTFEASPEFFALALTCWTGDDLNVNPSLSAKLVITDTTIYCIGDHGA